MGSNSTSQVVKIQEIEDDEQLPGQVWFVASIINSDKIAKASDLDMALLKIYGTFGSSQDAEKKAQELRLANDKFDYPVGLVGTRSAFDIDKTEETEYGNKKLNKLNKKFKENDEKYQLMKDQFDNEHTIVIGKRDPEKQKTKETVKKLKEKKAMEATAPTQKPINQDMWNEIEAAYKTDYLDESPCLSGQQVSILTIYDFNRYRNLDMFSFKIRGCFPTINKDPQNQHTRGSRHMNKLKKEHPYDTIGNVATGFWTPVYKNGTNDSPDIQLKKANYLMKLYLEDFEKQKKDFKKHKRAEKTKIKKKQEEQRQADDTEDDIPHTDISEPSDEEYRMRLEKLRASYPKVVSKN
jgi:hypothetical protein